MPANLPNELFASAAAAAAAEEEERGEVHKLLQSRLTPPSSRMRSQSVSRGIPCTMSDKFFYLSQNLRCNHNF